MKTRRFDTWSWLASFAVAVSLVSTTHGQSASVGRRLSASQERLFAGEATASSSPGDYGSITAYSPTIDRREAPAAPPYTPLLRREPGNPSENQSSASASGFRGGAMYPASHRQTAYGPQQPAQRFAANQAGNGQPVDAKPLPPSSGAPMHEGATGSMNGIGGMSDCHDCDPCCGECDDWLDAGRWFAPGRGSWAFGAEYLFARPHFSEPVAYIIQIRNQVGPGNQVFSADLPVYFAYDYESSFRAYAAYRLCDCCSEFRFTWTSLDSHNDARDTTDALAQRIPTRFEIQPGAGNTLTATSRIKGDIWDADFARCIRQGDECCDPCDPCAPCCPLWDLQWSVGLRVADWGYNYNVFTNVPTDGRLNVEMDFIGAGPKVGLEGRRYWGDANQFKIYSTLDVALILGWYEHDAVRTVPPVGVNPTSIEQWLSKITRTVPMTEIELGASWRPARNWEISAGWFFQVWWDLGMTEQQTSNLLGANGPQVMLDDSNIMSWDGLTARVEFTW